MTKRRRSNTDDLIEARAEITRLRAENDLLRAAVLGAKTSNDLIHTLVQDMIKRLDAQINAAQPRSSSAAEPPSDLLAAQSPR